MSTEKKKKVAQWLETIQDFLLKEKLSFKAKTVIAAVVGLIGYLRGASNLRIVQLLASLKLLHKALGKGAKLITWAELKLSGEEKKQIKDAFSKALVVVKQEPAPAPPAPEPTVTPEMPPKIELEEPPGDRKKDISELQSKINRLDADLFNSEQIYGKFWQIIEHKKLQQRELWQKELDNLQGSGMIGRGSFATHRIISHPMQRFKTNAYVDIAADILYPLK